MIIGSLPTWEQILTLNFNKMKKNTFYSLLFVATLIGCAVIESSDTYSSEAIRNAELGTPSETSQEEPETAYIITLNPDSILVIDPDTGKTILKEKYDSKSTLAEAILKDNE